MDSRLGGSARMVHQKHNRLAHSQLRHKKHDCASDGPYTGSIGSEVLKWTAR